MTLADVQIAKTEGLITPFNTEQLQPASYDLTLEEIIWFDKEEPHSYRFMSYSLRPGEFVLGSTMEYVSMPTSLVGRIEGKSSLARKGLIVHTAGFVDPGFKGNLTLEMTNLGPFHLELTPGMRIAQIAFQHMSARPLRPYGHPDLGSHYQDQRGATPSAL